MLTTEYIGRNIVCLGTTCSTNTWLMERADELPSGTAVTAEHQSGGRGRLGRSWYDPGESALLISVLIKSGGEARSLALLPLACGLAAAQALNSLCGGEIALKWPNDIVSRGKKVGGILCESRLSSGRGSYVCGFGINLSQGPEFFAGELAGDELAGDAIAGGASLRTLGFTPPGREEAAAALMNNLEQALGLMKDGGIIGRYSEMCVTLGARVRALDGSLEGTAVRIAPDGALVVLARDGEHRVSAGDVSLRAV